MSGIDKNEMKKAYVEVISILQYLNKEEYNKIPKDYIYMLNSEKDKNYTWVYNESKPLKNQNILEYTKYILADINMKYLLNTEQKKLMSNIFKFNSRQNKNT